MAVDGEENGKGKKEGLQSLVERKTISLSLSCKTENNIQDNILQVNPGKPKDIEDGLATRNARWGNNKTTSLTLNLADVWIIGGSSCRKTNNYPDPWTNARFSLRVRRKPFGGQITLPEGEQSIFHSTGTPLPKSANFNKKNKNPAFE